MASVYYSPSTQRSLTVIESYRYAFAGPIPRVSRPRGPDNFVMRLFLGIPLAEALAGELAVVTERLRRPSDGLRWSRSESWHITLQFLGETGQAQLDCALARLRELQLPAIPISLDSLSFFDRSGVFIAAVRLSPELRNAQQRISEATAQCGFVPESRPYQAHITLARSKDREGGRVLRALKASLGQAPAFSSFVACEFLLYESFLGPGGSRYQVRARFPLSAERLQSDF